MTEFEKFKVAFAEKFGIQSMPEDLHEFQFQEDEIQKSGRPIICEEQYGSLHVRQECENFWIDKAPWFDAFVKFYLWQNGEIVPAKIQLVPIVEA